MCSSKKCAFDSTSLWFVDLVEVKLDPAKAWDSGSTDLPDVFVEVNTAADSHTTVTIDNNYSPVFNEYLFLSTADELMATFHFVIKDKDFMFNDTICDYTTVIFQSEIENGVATIPYPCDYVDSIKFKFY